MENFNSEEKTEELSPLRSILITINTRVSETLKRKTQREWLCMCCFPPDRGSLLFNEGSVDFP
jgi:hypothetical protein